MKKSLRNNNKDLTIIILTFNRHKEIIKKINFWNNYNFKIFIIDGSEKKINFNIKINKNIQYFHLPNKDYHERIFFIERKIKTKFVKFESDDDYFYPSTLSKGVEFLKRNSSFSACIGSSYIYSCFKNEVYLNKLRFNHHNIINNDPFERMLQSFKNYSPTLYYSIFTKKVFKHITKIWKKLKKRYKDKFLLFPEIIVTITICFLGKIKYFPNIYWIRKDEEVKNRIEFKSLHKFIKKNHSYDKLFEFFSSKLDTNYFDYFIYSFKNLNTEILKKSGNEKFKKNLIYFYKTRSEIKKNKITNRLIPLKNTIALFFPSFLKKRIRFYFKINGPKLSEFVRSNNKLFLNKKDVNLLKEFLIY